MKHGITELSFAFDVSVMICKRSLFGVLYEITSDRSGLAGFVGRS